nr:DNA-directed DNA polymerase [Tanacetum cinerariifolium]
MGQVKAQDNNGLPKPIWPAPLWGINTLSLPWERFSKKGSDGILKDATPRVDAAKKVVSPSVAEEFAVKESPEVNTSDLGSNPPLPLQEANLAGNALGKPSYANATDTENPYDHIRLFLSIVENIRADGATRDASQLHFFHFTLKGEAKKWLERLSRIHATSWEQLSSHFLNKFFPPKRTAFNRSQILQFR